MPRLPRTLRFDKDGMKCLLKMGKVDPSACVAYLCHFSSEIYLLQPFALACQRNNIIQICKIPLPTIPIRQEDAENVNSW